MTQGLICLLPYRNIVLVSPVILILVYKILNTILMTAGFLPNHYADGVIHGRTTPVYATEKGARYKECDQQLCAIMLAVRSNHPLGMFAYGFKEVGDYFRDMISLMDQDPTKYGYLGSSAWLSVTDRSSSHELMSMVYFKNEEYLHAWAHDKLHTEGWLSTIILPHNAEKITNQTSRSCVAMEWWQKSLPKVHHIAIMHEVYAAPKQCWEGVYINYHPTGLGQTTTEANIDGRKLWVNPLVRGKGRLNYSKGRMGRIYDPDSEWTAYDKTLSEEEKKGIEIET